MDKVSVQLLCPECDKTWESTPDDLPDLRASFYCPNCHATRRTAEFMRTDRDLETVQALR
jgi:ssDNA-binding Zn-finger/Zn-ribbon topoisomerase 1